MPLFCIGSNSDLSLKPVLQLIFEQLYEVGLREFCFVVGRGKRAVEDHFTPDWDFVKDLRDKGKSQLTSSLEAFYNTIKKSTIVWVNQPEPKGFGHAVLIAKPFVVNEPFMVCAGDTYIVSRNDDHIRRLVQAYSINRAEATLLLQKVDDPRQYGVAVVEDLSGGVFRVLKVVEKPREPPSNLAIMPMYIFKPVIFDVLEDLAPGVSGEIQLTDGIQKLIDLGLKVQAIMLRDDEFRLDIGTPEMYWEALKLSYEYFRVK